MCFPPRSVPTAAAWSPLHGTTRRVWDVLLDCCDSQRDADRLAALAEIVSGVEVSDTGSLAPVGIDRRERMAEFVRSAKPDAPLLSVDWLIGEFGRRFRI